MSDSLKSLPNASQALKYSCEKPLILPPPHILGDEAPSTLNFVHRFHFTDYHGQKVKLGFVSNPGQFKREKKPFLKPGFHTLLPLCGYSLKALSFSLPSEV